MWNADTLRRSTPGSGPPAATSPGRTASAVGVSAGSAAAGATSHERAGALARSAALAIRAGDAPPPSTASPSACTAATRGGAASAPGVTKTIDARTLSRVTGWLNVTFSTGICGPSQVSNATQATCGRSVVKRCSTAEASVLPSRARSPGSITTR